MKLYLFSFLLAFKVLSAQATEVNGVKLDDSVKLGESTLVLNGAGIRTKLMFKVYVGALYLTAKKADTTLILFDSDPKRVSLHILRNLSAEKLVHALDEGLEANNSANELVKIEPQLKSFRQQMTSGGAVKEGDVLELDYIPSIGTQARLNGKILGTTEGESFNRALLKVWLGDHPVDDDLKKAMLGTH
jgi:long-chain acyl-CoA synthetase